MVCESVQQALGRNEIRSFPCYGVWGAYFYETGVRNSKSNEDMIRGRNLNCVSQLLFLETNSLNFVLTTSIGPSRPLARLLLYSQLISQSNSSQCAARMSSACLTSSPPTSSTL